MITWSATRGHWPFQRDSPRPFADFILRRTKGDVDASPSAKMVGRRRRENVIKPIWPRDGEDRLESNRTAGSAERNRITREGMKGNEWTGRENGWRRWRAEAANWSSRKWKANLVFLVVKIRSWEIIGCRNDVAYGTFPSRRRAGDTAADG